jgi:hypothetical protein
MSRSLSWMLIESGAVIVAGLTFLMSMLVERHVHAAIVAACVAFVATNAGFLAKYIRSRRTPR